MDKQPLTPTNVTPVTPVPPAHPEVVTMPFPEAIRMIMDGKKVKRLSWSPASDYGILKDGWLMIFTEGDFHVWKVNDGDMEGLDWVVVEESN